MRKLNTKWMHPRDQIILIIDKIYRSGMTTTSGGNISGNTIGTPNYLTNDQIDEFEKQIPRLLPAMQKVEYPSDQREIREQIKKIVHSFTLLLLYRVLLNSKKRLYPKLINVPLLGISLFQLLSNATMSCHSVLLMDKK